MTKRFIKWPASWLSAAGWTACSTDCPESRTLNKADIYSRYAQTTTPGELERSSFTHVYLPENTSKWFRLPSGLAEALQLLCESEDQQTAAGETGNEHAERDARHFEPGGSGFVTV